MKKLVFATALAIGGLTLGTAATPIIFHDGIMEELIVQDFKEIAVSDVPSTVVTALETDYSGATLNKAYVNAEGQYKLEVSTAEGSNLELYADAEGNWIEI
ncbi:hypothetical protein J8L85_01430 [Maribacter sp. MMG018]|uniref:hypothetical protein n=1 Tax=Maribacter sp. MMG018 TaxID=2822688 RepID=UPI001B36E31C|nr:hypothetical protein [Maribacter sp. MMG018]MBQ4913079.1 hypothetical protein [Maribacter sp. MMG018]